MTQDEIIENYFLVCTAASKNPGVLPGGGTNADSQKILAGAAAVLAGLITELTGDETMDGMIKSGQKMWADMLIGLDVIRHTPSLFDSTRNALDKARKMAH